MYTWWWPLLCDAHDRACLALHVAQLVAQLVLVPPPTPGLTVEALQRQLERTTYDAVIADCDVSTWRPQPLAPAGRP